MKTTTDLEARIMNRLQTMKRGQTIEQLETYLGEPQSKILAVLMPLHKGAVRHHVQGRRSVLG